MDATETTNSAPDSSESVDLERLPDAVLTHGDEVAWVLVEDEVVAYHAPSATSHVLNPSAGLIWRCVDGQSTLRDILVDVADIYQVDAEQLLLQVVPVVAEWVDAELVALDGVSPAAVPPTGHAANEEWERLPDPPNQ